VKIGPYLLWAASAVVAGIFVLLGYLIENQVILSLRLVLMRWAVLLAAVALLLGLYNLLIVHWQKVSEQETGWPYSAVLILAFLVTLVLGLVFGPDNEVVLLLFNYIHLPVEASLMALLAVSLVVAGFRIVSHRRDVVSLVFVGTAVLILLGTGPWPIAGESEFRFLLGELRNWIAQVWAAGGARGIVLGVALGAVVTGLRVLLVVDRPYGD
jgi:hypothetical protein